MFMEELRTYDTIRDTEGCTTPREEEVEGQVCEECLPCRWHATQASQNIP